MQTDGTFIYNLFDNFYSIGVETNKSTVEELSNFARGNGVKSNFIDTITILIIPKTFNNLPVSRLGYRCFREMNGLTEVIIPNTLMSFGGDTFVYCRNLKKVTFEINSKMKNFAYYVFFCTIIKTIELPRTSVSITDHSFSEMSKLTDLFIHNFLKSTLAKDTMFQNSNQDLTIHVPKNYPYKTFANVKVTKDLPRYYEQPVTCNRNKKSTFSSILIIICLIKF